MPSRSLGTGCALGLLVACSAAPSRDPDAHHRTVMVTIAAERLLPMAEVYLPPMATVVFSNTTAVPVRIEVADAACPNCDTVLGFHAAADCARSDSIPPGGVATLCFHAPGDFPFVAVGAITQRGILHVEGWR